MDKKDLLWQDLLDGEKSRLASLRAEELMAIEFHSSWKISHGEMTINCGVWHEEPGYRFGTNVHSFVLKATRKLFLGFRRNYLAGFSLDSDGRIVPIVDETLYSYD